MAILITHEKVNKKKTKKKEKNIVNFDKSQIYKLFQSIFFLLMLKNDFSVSNFTRILINLLSAFLMNNFKKRREKNRVKFI